MEPIFQPGPENRCDVWVTGFGDFVNVDADANANGYDFTTGGRCWRLFLAYDFSKIVLTPLKTQVRTQVLNEDWRSTLSRWCPWMEETLGAKAA